MKKAVAVLWVLVLVLASCGQTGDGVPVVRAQPGTGGGVTTFQVEISARAQIGNRDMQTPRGIRAAYMFDKGNLIARTDIPGAMFPDSKARVLITNRAAKTARVYLADTMQPDAQVENSGQLSQALLADPTGLGLAFTDISQPFRRMTPDQFLMLSKRASFDVDSQTPQELILTRKTTEGQIQRKMTISFDTQAGAVKKIKDTTETPEAHIETETTISYVSVEGIEDTAVPYKVETSAEATLRGKSQVAKVQLPKADVVLKRGAKGPQLNANEVVVNTFTAPPGEGPTNPNTQKMAQTVTFEDIKVNKLTPDFFLIGGR